jgi:hypothetical protein
MGGMGSMGGQFPSSFGKFSQKTKHNWYYN